MPGTLVRALVEEDPTCCGVHASQLLSPHSGGHEPQLLKPVCPGACALQQEKPPKWEASAMQLESSPCSPQLEMLTCSNEDPAQPKINYKEMVWWVLKKLNVGLAFDSAIPYICVCVCIYIYVYIYIYTHPKKLQARIQTETYTPMFRAALFTIAKS